jgi:pSer/pThr/pTyr-binding forkhead associated (FHA) protein
MDTLTLRAGTTTLRALPLDGRPVEIGRDPRCDLAVDDPSLAPRHALVTTHEGVHLLWELGAQPGSHRARPRLLSLDAPQSLGALQLVRLSGEPSADSVDAEPRTERLPSLTGERGGRFLVVGAGPSARRVRLGPAPLTLGTAGGCDVLLYDRTVSAQHCRLEPSDAGLFVRDLGSRNGTWVDGLRVERARLGPGSRLRLGRTDLGVLGAPADVAEVGGMIAASPQMQAALAEVERLARVPWAVLVTGESGAGKEGIARALHARGPRAPRAFVAINAGALARDVVESELFGHERGAFTGASERRAGVFEQASGGTLFLDEVGELPLDLQARLLRVLDTGELRRVGGTETVRVDVRVVCATHRDLRGAVRAGRFRHDLYFRLAQWVIEVPPLRERPEDLVALSAHFLREIGRQLGTQRVLAPAALERLAAHRWPGNARELRNVLCAAATACGGEVIEAEDVVRALARTAELDLASEEGAELVRRAVEAHRGNVTAAARALGLPRTTVRDRLRACRA